MQEVISAMQKSHQFAKKNPLSSMHFVLEKSQEKSIDIVRAHINAYVNEETAQLSAQGIQAIKTLIGERVDETLCICNT